jgi:hypothetical protein
MARAGRSRRAGAQGSKPSKQPRAAGAPLARHAPATAFGAAVLLYAALKTYQLTLGNSDENIYFYMALRTVTDGLLPYRDYFFAHPPLHLGLGVLALWFGSLVHGAGAIASPEAWADGGAAVECVKAVGVVAGAVGGVAIWRAVHRVAGAVPAWLAGVSFLFAPDLLHSYFTGIAEALMFSALGLERVVAGRDRQAGLCFAAGCLVAMYVAPAGLAIWLVLLAVDRRRALTLALWTAVPLLLVHGVFLLWAGRAYWEAVFAYHLRKPKNESIAGEELLLLLRKSSLLVMAVPAALVALLGGERPTRERLRADPRLQLAAYALAALALTLLFVTATRAVFHYYFVMLMLGLAPLAGLAWGELVRRAVALARAARAHVALRAPATALGALLAFPVAGLVLERLPPVRRAQTPDKIVGGTAPREWHDSPVLGPFNGAVRALFWEDTDVLGRVYSVPTRFLWDASRRFEMADLMARYARTLPPEATVFGDSTLATAVALRAGRRLALDEADTNFMRFKSGITPPAAFVARLRAAPPALIVFSVGEYMLMGDDLHAWMEADYEQSLANDANGRVYNVMRPKMR